MSAPWTIFRLSAAIRGNKTVYWLGRIPLLRRLVSDSLYAASEGKLALTCVLMAWRALRALVGKALYLALACALLPGLIALDSPAQLLSPQGFGLLCWALLWCSFLTGTLLQPPAVAPSQLKYTCVRMMSMNARTYQLWAGAGAHLSDLAGFTPCLMIASALMGASPWAGLAVSLELALTRIAAEGLHVAVYRRTGVAFGHKVWYIILMVIISLAGAYAPLAAGLRPMPQTALLHPIVPGALLILAGAAALYLFRYDGYYRLVLDTCKPESISSELAKQKTAGAQFRDVRLRESDLTAEGDSGLAGWPYLQALFFRRHRRMLYKPVKVVLLILAGVTLLGCAGLLLLRGLAGDDLAPLFDLAPRALPYCVFFLYFMDNSVGSRLCKAMFYNCDLAMLRYGWYRQPQVVLKNFMLRFTRLCGANLLISGAACLMFTALTLCAGGRPPLGEYLIFMAALLCLGVFFAVHSLGMYYLFQPYTSDLQVKNPFFGVINGVVYVLCYACIQIRSTPSWFALLVLAVTVVYSALILFFVWRRAPRTFRVK